MVVCLGTGLLTELMRVPLDIRVVCTLIALMKGVCNFCDHIKTYSPVYRSVQLSVQWHACSRQNTSVVAVGSGDV